MQVKEEKLKESKSGPGCDSQVLLLSFEALVGVGSKIAFKGPIKKIRTFSRSRMKSLWRDATGRCYDQRSSCKNTYGGMVQLFTQT